MGIIDPKAIRRLEQLNSPDSEDIVVRLIVAFLSNVDEREKTYKTALRVMNFDAIQGVAHQLRSGCASLGLTRLMDTCEKMESAAKARDHTRVRAQDALLTQSWAEAVQALEKLRKSRLSKMKAK